MIERGSSTVASLNPRVPGLQATRAPSTVSSFLGLINQFLEWFGDLGIFFWRVVRAAVTPPFEFHELFRQLDEIGSMSCPWSHWLVPPLGLFSLWKVVTA